MLRQFHSTICIAVFSGLLALLTAPAALAQTTSFTYQGRLGDGGSLANGVYDLQLSLFDAVSAGNQVGSTLTYNDVTVTNGVFTLSPDLGAAAFSGASRFLEIAVRPGASSGAYTTLAAKTTRPEATTVLQRASTQMLLIMGPLSGGTTPRSPMCPPVVLISLSLGLRAGFGSSRTAP